MVHTLLYLFAMLIPAAVDMVDGKELQCRFMAAGALRDGRLAVVNKDGKADSPVPQFASSGTVGARAGFAFSQEAAGHFRVSVKEVLIQRQLLPAFETGSRSAAVGVFDPRRAAAFAADDGTDNFGPMGAMPIFANRHVAVVAQGLEAVGQAVFFKNQADIGNAPFPTVLRSTAVQMVDAQELKEVGSATDAMRLAATGVVRQDFGPNKTGAIQIFCVYNRLPALSADGFQAERMLGARRKELCGEREVGFARPASLASRLDLRLVPTTAASSFEADKIVGPDWFLRAARTAAQPEVIEPTVSVGEPKDRPAAECLAGEVFEAFGAADKMRLSHDASLEQSVVVRVLTVACNSRQDSFILSLFPHKTTSVELN